MDNFKSGFVSGWLPHLKGAEVFNDDGAGGGHIYIPRFNNIPGGQGRKSDILRGWQYQPGSGSREFPGYSRSIAGFGSEFKKRVREQNPAMLSLAGFGECLPDFNNYCEIDPGGLKDRYGIPQQRFHAKWGENDLKIAGAMYDAAEELLRAAGAENLRRRFEYFIVVALLPKLRQADKSGKRQEGSRSASFLADIFIFQRADDPD